MTRKNLADSAKKLSDFLDVIQRQIAGGFSELKDDQPLPDNDPRLAVIYAMFANPKGPLNQFLSMLGGPGVSPHGAGAPTDLPAVPVPPSDKAGVLSFEQFLTSVGDAMLNAQKQLDAKSAEYLAQTSSQPHIQPTVFRLPKLTAAMKFAFDKVDDQRMNLVFFSSGSKESSQHQQQIEFDIVSAPAPLEALGELRQRAPRLDLILDPPERARVFEAASGANPKRPTSRLPDSFVADRALLLSSQPGRTYLILFADPKEPGNVGMWRLTLDAPPALDAIYRFDKQFAEAETSFQELVNQLADVQAAFLASLRP